MLLGYKGIPLAAKASIFSFLALRSSFSSMTLLVSNRTPIMIGLGTKLPAAPKALKVLHKVNLPIFFFPNSQERFHKKEDSGGKELTRKCYNNKIF